MRVSFSKRYVAAFVAGFSVASFSALIFSVPVSAAPEKLTAKLTANASSVPTTDVRALFDLPNTASAAYRDCLNRVTQEPVLGRRFALGWLNEGGGTYALHCAAVADLANDLPKVAAIRLLEIAEREVINDATFAVQLYMQAAEAWLIAGQEEFALKAARTAYSYEPETLEVVKTLAKVHKMMGQYDLAIVLLGSVEKTAGLDDAALILRAQSYLAQGDSANAARDTAIVLERTPLNVDALVLRGNLTQQGIFIK